MLQCPYCLNRAEPKTEIQGHTTFYVCSNEQCNQRLAREYVESSFPRTAIGIIGYSGHGKTSFLHSLFYVLSLMEIEWSGYHSKSLDDETDHVIHTMVRHLQDEAQLPPSTAEIFPRPALLLHNNIPDYGNWFITMYDTAGAVFEDVQKITEQGRYVAHAETIFFLVSLADQGENPADRLKFLLGKYLRAVHDHMRVDLKKQQNLVVVFTKADILRSGRHALTKELDNCLGSGTYLGYKSLAKEGKNQLHETSRHVETWLKKLGCQGFVSMARNNFRNVSFTVVSATGAETEGQSLGAAISPQGPKRMLDPLLWALEYGQARHRQESWWKILSPIKQTSRAQGLRTLVVAIVLAILLGGGYLGYQFFYAADQGWDVMEEIDKGLLYEGLGGAKNEAKAVELFRKGADQGDAEAQTHLGFMLETGRGVAKDEGKAVDWYRKAVDQGYAEAQFHLGEMYRDGRGVAKDEVKALKLYRKAADQGVAPAQAYLGMMYEHGRFVAKDEARAVEWYRKSADQGFAYAQDNLGKMYADGRGVAKDEVKAVEWYRKAADQGNAYAQNSLGVMYMYGRGVAKDEAKSVEWCRKAADQGNANAQNNLGGMYAYGLGVAKDEAKAVEWYRKAADQGYAKAIKRLKKMGITQ